MPKCDAYVVNNLEMARQLGQKKSFVIPHHWDPDLAGRIEAQPADRASFGFMGSLYSLRHTANLLHAEKLARLDELGLCAVETEEARVVQRDEMLGIIRGSAGEPKVSRQPMKNLPRVPFNVHLSVRAEGTPEFLYKTSAKVVTAAALGHNIVTTREPSVMEVLPRDYPFLLADSRWDTLVNMIGRVEDDFRGDKKLWRRGLRIMDSVRERQCLPAIAGRYLQMITALIA